MPWINDEACTGCQLCVSECSVGAISMKADAAIINEEECIRCGVCHDVCPNDAVRHDSERIPEEVASNVAWARALLGHAYYANNKNKQKALLQRLRRHFAKNRKVMDKTLEQLEILQETEYADC